MLKHGILARYLPAFVGKAGYWAKGRRVVYLDGYAGPGVYEDDSPGSPELAIKIAIQAAQHRDVECLFVERDRKYFQQLRDRLTRSGHANWHAWHGRLEERLPEVLAQTAGQPMFALLDPFGMGLPFTQLTTQLLGRASGPRGRIITEVLLNFSTSAVVRSAGLLHKQPGSARQRRAWDSTLQHLSDTLGGDWWKEVYDSHDRARWLDEVVRSYIHQLRNVGSGWTVWKVPVADHWEARPDYYLIFLTQHPDGVWKFGEAVSLSMEEYYEHCLVSSRQLAMDLDLNRADRWIARLITNLEALVAKGEPFVIGQRYSEVFAGVLGYARETHLRTALTRLQQDGRLVCNTKGPLKDKQVRPRRGDQSGQTGASAGY